MHVKLCCFTITNRTLFANDDDNIVNKLLMLIKYESHDSDELGVEFLKEINCNHHFHRYCQCFFMVMQHSQVRDVYMRHSTCLSCLSIPHMVPSTLLSTTRSASPLTLECPGPHPTALVSEVEKPWPVSTS